MSKKQKYFIKQKLIGVGMVAIGILSAWLLRGEVGNGDIMLLIGIPGLVYICSRKMLIHDDYYYEVKERERLIEIEKERGLWK